MPELDEVLRAYLIIDNCFFVMLIDCFCDRYATKFPPARTITEAEQWSGSILNIIRRFSLDGNLFCSCSVANEYKPSAGRMATIRGIQYNEIVHLQEYIRAQLQQEQVDIPSVQLLRTLPDAPRHLVGVGGLSDKDLSLVKLGLDLTRTGSPVYILSNDQGLLEFISWTRIQKQHFQAPITPNLIQGWRCLTYLDLVHHSCNITSDLMRNLSEYALAEHYNRKELAGSQKGNVIFQQLLQVLGNFNQSVVIKQQV